MYTCVHVYASMLASFPLETLACSFLTVFNCIEEYAPGFKQLVVGKEVLTPPDLERIFGLTGGVSPLPLPLSSLTPPLLPSFLSFSPHPSPLPVLTHSTPFSPYSVVCTFVWYVHFSLSISSTLQNIFHGSMSLDQLYMFRPIPLNPGHATPIKGLYLCGSGTHPGQSNEKGWGGGALLCFSSFPCSRRWGDGVPRPPCCYGCS